MFGPLLLGDRHCDQQQSLHLVQRNHRDEFYDWSSRAQHPIAVRKDGDSRLKSQLIRCQNA
jgi:hypothetical protein